MIAGGGGGGIDTEDVVVVAMDTIIIFLFSSSWFSISAVSLVGGVVWYYSRISMDSLSFGSFVA